MDTERCGIETSRESRKWAVMEGRIDQGGDRGAIAGNRLNFLWINSRDGSAVRRSEGLARG